MEDLDRFMDSFGSFGALRSPVDLVVPHGGQRHPFADHARPQNFKITGGSSGSTPVSMDLSSLVS